jgi:adenylyltransferase/sulfurtransferase
MLKPLKVGWSQPQAVDFAAGLQERHFMTVTVHLPPPLRQYVGQLRTISADGKTLGELLGNFTATHPELRCHLLDSSGRLRSFVNLYLNGEDIRYLQQEATPLKPGDDIRIVPTIAGGSGPASTLTLNRDEISRYSRHLIMPEVGMEGQLKLKSGKVLVVGVGGLGSPLALYLAAAGVGTIGIVDFDTLDLTNLQRQVLYSTESIGRSKLESASERLLALNPEVEIRTHETRLTSENALGILKDYDVVVDGTDNFPTRYLVNDACVLLGKPNVYGSIFRFEGQASVFSTADGPCYRCLYPEPPPPGLVPSCAEGGVLGVLPGTIGLIQATEAVKLLLGIGEPLVGRLLLYDALRTSFRTLRLRKDPDCPVCGPNPTVHELIDYQQFCGIAPEQAEVLPQRDSVGPLELKRMLDRGAPLFLLDVREPYEWQICRISGATLIPLGQLPARMSELSITDDMVVFCHNGGRSAKAVEFLRKHGFSKVRNLKGGILAWADQVDPSMPRY